MNFDINYFIEINNEKYIIKVTKKFNYEIIQEINNCL